MRISGTGLLSFGFMVAVAALFTALPEVAMAQGTQASGVGSQAGEGLIRAFDDIASGNIGLFVGILVAAFGLYVWLIRQESWGVIMIIAGVIITAFPGIFEALSDGTNSILQAAGVKEAATRATDATR